MDLGLYQAGTKHVLISLEARALIEAGGSWGGGGFDGGGGGGGSW